ncbi:MAG TPA: cytochrome b N-terminal domain-containing protein [Anaerolineales bacterium]|nr:cytochrome b N-terminal domain-containing protein [Anaerolineales bacterium]
MIDNLFLHVHPNRVSSNSLKPATTLGLGLITICLFLVLTVTGLLLMFYYVPGVPEAYERMQDLIYVVPFGRLLRDIHRIAAEGMLISVLLHLLRVFFTGSYKPPAEFNWLVGLALLTLSLALSFTGYLLPWDQLSYWAITVSAGILDYYPVIHEPMRNMLLGGRDVGQEALLRFYVLHVFFLPGMTGVLIGYHVWRIRKDGGLAVQAQTNETSRDPVALASEAAAEGRRPAGGESVSSYPLLLWIEVSIFLAVVLVLLGLALAFPGRLGPLANPDHPPNPAKAPWYFVGIQELVSYSAAWGGVVVPVALLLGCLLLPYIDCDPHGVGEWFSRHRRQTIGIGAALMLTLIALTLIGAFARGPNWQFYWPGQSWPIPP